MQQLEDEVMNEFMRRLNAKLIEEARMRAEVCARGVETPELGGLVIHTLGQGMAEAVKILGQVINRSLPGQVDFDAATAMVDPNWRENMRGRWTSQAGISRSKPRTLSAR